MATSFPGAQDSFPTHSDGDTIYASIVNDVQDAVEALETKVGIDGSADPTSLDYRVTALENAGGGGGNGTPSPQDMPSPGLAWNFDPILVHVAQPVTAGTLYLSGIWLPQGGTITNIHIGTYKAGSSNSTGAFAGIWEHKSSGALLGISADHGAAINTQGLQTIPLTSPYAAAAGWYYVGFWTYGGTTQPDVWVAGGRFPLNPVFTVAGQRRQVTADTGLTTTAPTVLAGQQLYNDYFWVGLS